MKYLSILSFFLLVACGKKEDAIQEQFTDTLFVKSDSLFKQAIVTLPKSDQQFTKMVEKGYLHIMIKKENRQLSRFLRMI